MQTVITGTGSFLPQVVKKNGEFTDQQFYDARKLAIPQPANDVVEKFRAITGIEERRYADKGTDASTMAAMAGRLALEDARVDPETIDQLIVAHNFGDVAFRAVQSDAVPSLAARVKHQLGIKKPSCVAYDILFGCPGWLQGLIQADAFGKAGVAQNCLVIGTEALSRVRDIYDRDSMIFSDGAGAVVTQLMNDGKGCLKSLTASYAGDDLNYICMGESNSPSDSSGYRYIKMQGRKVYEFALRHVPAAIKECLDLNNIDISQVKKIFLHQANEKMDEAIIQRLFALYNITDVPPDIMPMNIKTMGNSSVATIPTLFDMVRKGVLEGHQLTDGDIIVFASVGAGMNINALCYKV